MKKKGKQSLLSLKKSPLSLKRELLGFKIKVLTYFSLTTRIFAASMVSVSVFIFFTAR